MNIRERAFNLQKIYQEMSEAFSGFQDSTKLNCMEGCGKCCMTSGIEASTVEMIPFALKASVEGRIEEWLNRLENIDHDYCPLFEHEGNGKGKCLSYQERPSVCRMFGVAGSHDKHHHVILSICRYLQEEFPEQSRTTMTQIEEANVPLMNEWSLRLGNAGSASGNKKINIHLAMKEALEQVGFYAMFQE